MIHLDIVADYVDNWSRHFEIPARVDLEALDDARPEHDVETVLYRTAQEALNNIAEHSGATEVQVDIVREGNELVLSIKDNGRGFEPKKPSSGGGGLGLPGMRERASLVGGSADIGSTPGAGTTVSVRMPADGS